MAPLDPEQREAVEAIASVISSAAALPITHQAALQAMRAAILQLKEKELEDDVFQEGASASGDFNLHLKQVSHGVEARTLTIFTLANHMSTESVELGIDPESLFQMFTGLNNPKAKQDLDFARKVMFSDLGDAGSADGDKGLHKITIAPPQKQVFITFTNFFCRCLDKINVFDTPILQLFHVICLYIDFNTQICKIIHVVECAQTVVFYVI